MLNILQQAGKPVTPNVSADEVEKSLLLALVTWLALHVLREVRNDEFSEQEYKQY